MTLCNIDNGSGLLRALPQHKPSPGDAVGSTNRTHEAGCGGYHQGHLSPPNQRRQRSQPLQLNAAHHFRAAEHQLHSSPSTAVTITQPPLPHHHHIPLPEHPKPAVIGARRVTNPAELVIRRISPASSFAPAAIPSSKNINSGGGGASSGRRAAPPPDAATRKKIAREKQKQEEASTNPMSYRAPSPRFIRRGVPAAPRASGSGSYTTAKRVVYTGAFAAVTIVGAIYGAGLKTRQERRQEVRQIVEAPPEDRIRDLEGRRAALLAQRLPLDHRLENLRARMKARQDEEREKLEAEAGAKKEGPDASYGTKKTG
ncbi:hypothetical protein GGR52DRAFT_590926 [Hypoxylon sp. FL1284]|nr:hypothetical protein GGR52DRAFT_590926 [Hypoxylon sp. FL1284]